MTFTLTPEEGTLLVKLARKAVQEHLTNRQTIKPPEPVSSKLQEPSGVFVTINSVERKKKTLRGCIGFPYPTHPLIKAVIETAIESATRDPRFPPMKASELDKIVFEVSVLTPPELVTAGSPKDYPSKIEVGVDGLIVERGYNKGLLLPQVPVEWKWDSEEFLCNCCMKAGLDPDCWVLKGTKIYKFTSIIAQELEPSGQVITLDLRDKGATEELRKFH
jgi:uncharacterized protein (TIGR00296 family)